MDIFSHYIIYFVVFFLISFVVFFFINQKYKKSRVYSDSEIELKLRAYERIILFIERIEPIGMINRLNLHQLPIDSIKSQIIKNIILEYEYNLSQQIYITNELWYSLVRIKDQTINHVSNICDNLKKDSKCQDFVSQSVKNKRLYKSYENIKISIRSEVHKY